ncbi:hypothetical protein [Rhodococcus wratislaviensis]|uniref:Uncharacterized protein n=1 Tax=Rhodococcus wratislaviensis NBRC 100605 TaxID=1219028 RepID=X0R3K9_RHOWR|nr:hypothetical protein [Rhodococcus wratislaviensis]GAF45455.1 hypothetical protein RW1_022_00320 [Rhodococcus wratislaviensis NBRC 100605]
MTGPDDDTQRPGNAELDPDERRELERLRVEVAQPRGERPPPAATAAGPRQLEILVRPVVAWARQTKNHPRTGH